MQTSKPTPEQDAEIQRLAELHKSLCVESKRASPAARKVTGFFVGRSFRNTFLALLGLLVLCGYAIFFSSTLWLPVQGTYSFTAPGSTLTFANHRALTLSRWDYSPAQNLMEVELEIDNPNFDGLDRYLCDSIVRTPSGERTAAVQTVVAQDDFFVLHILGIPKDFTELSLRIQVNDASTPGTAKLFSNKNDVRYVDNLTEKTKSEYLRDRVLALTDEYGAQIQKLEQENGALGEKIEAIREKNTQLEADKKYLTEQDLQKTQERIASNEAQLQAAQKQIVENESEISEFRLKIQKAEEKAQDITTEIQKENQMQQQELSEEFGTSSEPHDE